MKKKNLYIPYNKQFIDSNDAKTVSLSMKEKLITTGKYVENFEVEIKKKLKSKYALTCINGTAALHLAFLSINLAKNDVVIMPVINFIASYRIAHLMGAKVYLADVESVSGQMTPETLLDCIKKNNLKKIKLILTMQLGGYSKNNIEFFKIKNKYKCFLIEDACHAFGSQYKINDKKFFVGSCKHSDLAVFSFHPVKPITTGEGGAITTNNKKIANRISLLRSHGITRKKKYWDYEINELGFNYRLSDINCSLGLSQLKKINKFLIKRKKIFNIYQKNFLPLKNIIKVFDLPQNINSYHLILLSINFDKLNTTKNKLFYFLNKKKIFPQFHYKPIYKFKIYKEKNINNFFGAEEYYKNTISLPVYHSLDNNSQKYIIKNILYFINKHI